MDKPTAILFGALGGILVGGIAIAAITSGSEYYLRNRVPELMAKNIDGELKRLGISPELANVAFDTLGRLV